MMETETAYQKGGLSALIANKSSKKKAASEGVSTDSDKLSGIFSNPSVDDYAMKPVESVSKKY